MRRVAPAIGLFLLAPFVGEFLLGNLALQELPLGILLAPLYGGGALLIREMARRTGQGWPTIVLFAAAYALVEEGPVDQLLWNDSYAGADLLHGPSYIAALGMSVELTQIILVMHGVWSICVPIALMETLVPKRRTTPWLHTSGLVVTAVVYVAGAVFVFAGNYGDERFLATPLQIGGVSAAAVALVAAGFAVGRRALPRVSGQSPSPWLTGAAAFAGTSVYWGTANLVTARWYEWVGVGLWCVLVVAGVLVVSRWSRQEGWGQRHVFALAAGATLTYVWTAFPVQPESGGPAIADVVGNTVFGAVAVAILVLAACRLRCDSIERTGTPRGSVNDRSPPHSDQ